MDQIFAGNEILLAEFGLIIFSRQTKDFFAQLGWRFLSSRLVGLTLSAWLKCCGRPAFACLRRDGQGFLLVHKTLLLSVKS